MEDATNSTWIVAALDRYQTHLVRYATRILGDSDRAREIVQETFLRLCKQSPGRIGGHLAQWLFTVCRNLAFDARHKENRMSSSTNADPAGDHRSLLQKLEREEAISQIFRIIETLPDNQREVLRLKFQCDLSYQEISEATHLSVSNVGFLIHTAIKTLRELLAESAKRSTQ